MPVLAVTALAFSSLGLLAGMRLLLLRDLDARLADDSVQRQRRSVGTLLDLLDRVLGPRLERLMGPRLVRRVEQRLIAGGVQSRQAVHDHLGRRATNLALAGTGGLLLALMGNFFLPPLMLVVVWLLSERSLDAAVRKRSQQIQSRLPDFLDVVAVMLSAGVGFRPALRRVADSMPGPVAEEIDYVLREMELGVPLRDALTELRGRNQSEALDTFVTALLQADELGSPLTDAIVALADDVRRDAAHAARQRAARTAPRVSLVLTLVFVPASVLLLLAGILFGSEIDLGDLFSS